MWMIIEMIMVGGIMPVKSAVIKIYLEILAILVPVEIDIMTHSSVLL